MEDAFQQNYKMEKVFQIINIANYFQTRCNRIGMTWWKSRFKGVQRGFPLSLASRQHHVILWSIMQAFWA